MADKIASSPVVAAISGSTASVPTGTPKKTTAAKSKQPRTKPAHPKASEMVIAAITALKERGGSSLQAIKKYVAGTYKVDADKQATFIKKYLKAAVESGFLVQTKGKGAAGSFKLASTKVPSVKPKAKAASPKKAAVAKKPSAAKKPATVKKPAAAKKPAAVKKPTAAKKPAAVKKPTAAKKPAAVKKAAAAAKKPASAAAKIAPAKKAVAKAVTEKKTTSKGPAAKPPKAKTTNAKLAAKSPIKKAKPAAKKAKPAAPKAKKAAPKKAPAAKK